MNGELRGDEWCNRSLVKDGFLNDVDHPFTYVRVRESDSRNWAVANDGDFVIHMELLVFVVACRAPKHIKVFEPPLYRVIT